MAGSGLGVYYGRQTSNSPSAAQVVKMFKDNDYSKMWISEPDNALLSALNNQGIKVILGIPNSKIKGLSSDVYAANQWVNDNISAYPNVGFTHVCVGDLSNMSAEDGMDLVPAMENMHAALKIRNHKILVSTLVGKSCFASTYDVGTSPSKCEFRSKDLFGAILKFLKKVSSTLFIQVMPCFEMDNVPLEVKVDDNNFLLKSNAKTFLTDLDGTDYKFVFDAIVDSFVGAMSNMGFPDIKIAVASGWPREANPRDTWATVQNAKDYIANLNGHVSDGTPKHKYALETFIWSAFDEDKLGQVHVGWKHLGGFVFKWDKVTLP